MLELLAWNTRSSVGKGWKRDGGRAFLVLGAAHSKVLGQSTLEELKGRHCVGLKISVTGQGQMGLGGLEAAFWITQNFRIWASP